MISAFFRRLPGLGICLSVLLTLAGSPVSADDKKPGTLEADPDLSWMKDVTLKPRGYGNAKEIRPCLLKYKLSWRRVLSAGEAEIAIDRESSRVLVGTATAKSTGLARALWSYDCDLSARLDSQSLKPLGFEHSEVDKKETVTYVTEFKPGWVRTFTTRPNEKGVVETTRRTVYYGEALDLLSTILYVRSLPLEKGDKITRVVQPFDRPYLVTFTVDGTEQRKFEGKKIPTIKMSITILRVNKDLSLKSYDKMKEGTIWVSDDDFRLPIEIRADIFVGYITCLLKSREYTDVE